MDGLILVVLRIMLFEACHCWCKIQCEPCLENQNLKKKTKKKNNNNKKKLRYMVYKRDRNTLFVFTVNRK